MTGRTTLPTRDLDQLVPTLARQGIDASEREIVVEETVTRRIIIRAPAPEPTTTQEKDTSSWSGADPR